MIQTFHPNTVGQAPLSLSQVKTTVLNPGYTGTIILGATVASALSKYAVLKNKVSWTAVGFLILVYSIIFWITGAVSMYAAARK